MRDIESTAAYLHMMPEDHDLLRALHLVLFDSTGDDADRKVNLLAFNGFSYEDDSPEYNSIKRRLEEGHWKLINYKNLALLLNITMDGTVPIIRQKIMTFLKKPYKREKRGKGGDSSMADTVGRSLSPSVSSLRHSSSPAPSSSPLTSQVNHLNVL